ncbi:Eco57I restriction-modification methylase domain-containing protein [Pseudomonas aeruginosa]|uniref:Eco57I restriction-modification methylase domain-containing protein n=1 Tax=Pseudomonas aeruginosa TaxID=287 RepID=UPI00053CEF16|nr:type IIL restriction-modification enzyme MmeI [Pseudomonas aeruginosa]EKU7805049.1 restriction endonuclease [Pseudomonas aeruginosa]EKV3146448.1 restriction endonuclease [Pseudomonas aeruginosa]EKV6520655.1 restriction endonuclease [Pseudomonas aeruginosa]EKW5130257.1 restriction endonuclease [Pseudomonas aeruginosa]EKX3432780.1 restriction endonuclease [Pseudomonas aeruginosa]
MSYDNTHHDWLSLIEISGPFLAVPVLKEAFPQGLEELDGIKRKRLRQAYEEWREALELEDAQFAELHVAWIDEVLSRGLELDEDGKGDVLKRADWCAANLQVSFPEHGVTLSPDLAAIDEQRANKPLLLIQSYAQDVDLDATLKRDGWAATPADCMVQLCRSLGCRLGLVTNGERWMLVDAPVGAVSTFASWYARIWSQEPITLQAFVHLLGIRRFFVDESEQLPALFDRSLKLQDEVTDALGEQVRRAVEVLIQTLDKADQDRNRELLHDVKEPELYEAALTVMMRLVFLLSAEERGLLLMGDERYEANYALSTLRMLLRKESEEILERRWDAWSRLLAIFRAVFGGIEHENLRLPALGGSLFDPDRFPFLEGRAKGSNWRTDAAKPLPIDNRTVLLLLEAIQQFQGRTLSYRALDVEQIGYVYEGLLERTVKRADEVTLELDATKSAKTPWVKLAELDSARLDGAARLAELLQERSGSSASRVRNDLAKPIDDTLADRLLTACLGDTKLRDRVKPYAHLLRTDPWGYPLVYPAGAFIVTTGSDRRETGTHYTPKSLTEAIVAETLTPLAYVGPAEGAPRDRWALKSPAELLDLKICDPAMGSGAFLVQACRWLSDRLVEAWALVEATGKTVSVDGEDLEAGAAKEPLPRDSEARTVIARRLIAERCLYGVDLNPLAVELAKLSIWLVTLAKGRPFGFLDHNLRCGDSLLGLHRLDQLTQLSTNPAGQGQLRLFGQNIERAVRQAIGLRQQLREMPIRDIRDVEAMAHLDADARCRLEVPECIADAFIGDVFATGLNTTALEAELASLASLAGQAINGSPGSLDALRRRSHLTLSIDLPVDKPARQPFHWPLEFPEVFAREHGGFDGIVGNPPFLGGQRITGVAGTAFRNWLVAHIAEGRRGSADLVAYFFLRSWSLLREGGSFGLLAVNTIAEGDTRQVGLEAMVGAGAVIHAAYPNEPWPGKAAVVTSRVHVHKGPWRGECSLLGRHVPFISAFLSGREEWSPKGLRANEGVAYQGSIALGMGFVLSAEEAAQMLEADPKNAEVIFPYINGDDLNSDPEQRPGRWVINFWDWPEERAREYELPFERVLMRVKPERDKLGGNPSAEGRKKKWWLYGRDAKALYHAIGRGNQFVKHPALAAVPPKPPLDSVIAITRVSKYLNVALIPNASIFTLDLFVASLSDFASVGLLQSNIFSAWAWSRGGRMKHDLRFSGSDVLETFPMPVSYRCPEMEMLGEEFHHVRAALMREKGLGLTKITNLVHSPKVQGAQIDRLREAWSQIDAHVIGLYGWSDIQLNHGFHEVDYRPESDRVRFTISEAARVEVLLRLSELNRQRYEEELAQVLHGEAKPRTSSRAPRTRRIPNAATFQSSLDFDANPANEGRYLKVAEPPADYRAGPVRAIVEYLSTHPGWHAKASILAVTGITDGQWNVAIADLISRGRVERHGERRGTRYQLIE